jgi:spheroidene monooxygenase
MKSARDNGWFSEEFYARFHVLVTQGQWSGTDPLAGAWDTERHAA